MKTIDVEGLPEPVAQALAAIAEMWRQQMPAKGTNGKPGDKVVLHTRPGKAFGRLTRKEVYEDVN